MIGTVWWPVLKQPQEPQQQHPTTVLYLPPILCLPAKQPVNNNNSSSMHTRTPSGQDIATKVVNPDEERCSNMRGKYSAHNDLIDGQDALKRNEERSGKKNTVHIDFALKSIVPVELQQIEDTSDDGHECPDCGKVFRGLNIHRLVHKIKKSYECPVCSKTFRTQQGMENHRILRHTKDKHHECPDCGKHFRHHYVMKTHRRKHTGETPYECPECDKKFTTKGSLKTHKRVHTDCGKKYRHRTPMIRHKLTHTVEKPNA
ncbi:hypothetical protein Pcinc_011915 [Petrolisthes cinctipes]|uniref:C2H2-type domain-containing protein n=1 Tax=Petrolisthes cinctipes TaxID=88211 RepID=A0AAE1G1Y0_PETCI|nr:hypothetical protein Pcinc_011915 [Petrolisthes cinctipes]